MVNKNYTIRIINANKRIWEAEDEKYKLLRRSGRNTQLMRYNRQIQKERRTIKSLRWEMAKINKQRNRTLRKKRRELVLQRKSEALYRKNTGRLLSLGLSLLFFGMYLRKVTDSLLQPAFEVAGVFEIISTILQILFLPIALLLVPILLKVLRVVSNIPAPLKMVIGFFVLFISVLASVFIAVGSFLSLLSGLGVSVGLSLSFFGEVLASVGAVIASAAGDAIVLVGAFGLLVAMLGAYATNLFGIKDRVNSVINDIKETILGGLGVSHKQVKENRKKASSIVDSWKSILGPVDTTMVKMSTPFGMFINPFDLAGSSLSFGMGLLDALGNLFGGGSKNGMTSNVNININNNTSSANVSVSQDEQDVSSVGLNMS